MMAEFWSAECLYVAPGTRGFLCESMDWLIGGEWEEDNEIFKSVDAKRLAGIAAIGFAEKHDGQNPRITVRRMTYPDMITHEEYFLEEMQQYLAVAFEYGQMPLVDKARKLARIVHAEHRDKSDMPYILHLEGVCALLPDEDAKCVALLHDMVEDTDMTCEELLSVHEFPAHIVAAVDAVSRRSEETYTEFVERSLRDELGKRVKLADILDNNSGRRMYSLPRSEQIGMGNRYGKAVKRIYEAGVTLTPVTVNAG